MTGGPLDLKVRPTSEEDYTAAKEYIDRHRGLWMAQLLDGGHELMEHLRAAGYRVPPADAGWTADTVGADVADGEIAVLSRLKETQAIVAKMRRFGEPLCSMLDIWGYRLVVGEGRSIDRVAQIVALFWTTPSEQELLLRNGELRFPWWRDYRSQSHAGLSPIVSSSYDDAIHINRKASFGIAEFQVMTDDLYRRAHCQSFLEESHDRYVAERARLFRDR
jgi:hypothetical protein